MSFDTSTRDQWLVDEPFSGLGLNKGDHLLVKKNNKMGLFLFVCFWSQFIPSWQKMCPKKAIPKSKSNKVCFIRTVCA